MGFVTKCIYPNTTEKHDFWSDGYFACIIGEASSATVEMYIAKQG
jgi:putative transposase